MKQPKKLTRDQKTLVGKCKLLPDEYMLVSEDTDCITVINKVTDVIKVISKDERKVIKTYKR